MGNYRSLPFATYDLAVYLPGGAVLLVLLQYTFETLLGAPIVPSLDVSGHSVVDDVVLAVLWLSGSYLAGHLGAFMSTYLIERFVHKALGYPSDVWLRKERSAVAGINSRESLEHVFDRKISQFKWSEEGKYDFVSLLTLLALFPLWPYLYAFQRVRPFGFYVPKIPELVLPDIESAYAKTNSTIEIGEGTRWDKIVEHYVANNCPAAYQRMYNYLVIYGALRLLAFILLFASWVVLLKSGHALFQTTWAFSPRRLALLIGASFAGFMAILAFAKFNRRYFEESLMALLMANIPLKKNLWKRFRPHK